MPPVLLRRLVEYVTEMDRATGAPNSSPAELDRLLAAAVAALEMPRLPASNAEVGAVLPSLAHHHHHGKRRAGNPGGGGASDGRDGGAPPVTLPTQRNPCLAAVLWRRGRWAHVTASSLPTPDAKLQQYAAGLAAVVRSLALNEADGQAHKLAGILYARSARDTRERIANGYKIREHEVVRVGWGFGGGWGVRGSACECAREQGWGEAFPARALPKVPPPSLPAPPPPPHPTYFPVPASSAPRSCHPRTPRSRTSWACGATRWRR